MGRCPGLLDLYLRTHTKKKSRENSSSGCDSVQWVDPRSQRFHDDYLAKSSQRSTEGGESSQPVDSIDTWYEVTDGQKKGRTIGAGGLGDPRYVLTGESSSSQTHRVDSSSHLDELRSQLTEEHQLRIAIQQSLEDMQRDAQEARQRVEQIERESRERAEQVEREARERAEHIEREARERAERDRMDLAETMRKMMEDMMHNRYRPQPPP